MALALGLLCSACAGDWPEIPAAGEIDGHRIETTVDSEIAAYYLEHYTQGRRTDPELDRRLDAALARVADGVPTREELAWLTSEFSTDLATLVLIEALSNVPENARLRDVFEAHLRRVRTMAENGIEDLRRCTDVLDLPVVWFVPGWFYIDNPATGADFHRQRALLERLGVEHRLIRTIENGTIGRNAAILADEIRELDEEQDSIMLVSASKGGPEVAHALGHLLRPEETRPVEAWVNVGGLLRGSPLADWATSWPISWVAPFYFKYVEERDPGESVESLTTERSEARLAQQDIPDHVMIINFVGVPLSGHISPAAEFGYGRMRDLGPNDGLTPIVDIFAHGGREIVQVGLDHYYRDPELDLKTVALALTVVTEMGREPPAACRIDAS